MDLKTRHALIRQMAVGYQKASKKTRSEMLSHIILATGYHRWHAS